MPSSRHCSKVALLMSSDPPPRRDLAAFAFVTAFVSLAFAFVPALLLERLVVLVVDDFEARLACACFFDAAAFLLRTWAALARASFLASVSFSRAAFFS